MSPSQQHKVKLWLVKHDEAGGRQACMRGVYLLCSSCSRNRRSCVTPIRARSAFSNLRSSLCSNSVTSWFSRSVTASLKCSLLRKIASFALPTRPDGTDLQTARHERFSQSHGESLSWAQRHPQKTDIQAHKSPEWLATRNEPFTSHESFGGSIGCRYAPELLL